MCNQRQDSVWIATAILVSVGVSAAGASCDSLAGLKLQDANVTSATVVAAGAYKPATGSAAPFKDLPEFCRVEGVIPPSADSHIEFEVWLPVTGWNGKYLGVGNGGFAGSIGYPALADAVMNGYVVSSTDTGHEGGATDGRWALGHYEKIVDYGYRGDS